MQRSKTLILIDIILLSIVLFCSLFLGTSIGQRFGFQNRVTASMAPLLFYVLYETLMGKIKWNKKRDYYAYIIICAAVFFIFLKLLFGQNYFKTFLCYLILPMLISVVLGSLTNIEKKILLFFVLFFYCSECLLAIFERVIQINILSFEDIIDGSFGQDQWEFRSTALLGHPLMNAYVVSIFMAFILVCNRIKLPLKVGLWFLGYISILSFNARGATIVDTIFMGPLLLKYCFNKISKRNIILVLIIIISLFVFFNNFSEIEWGGRLLNSELVDESTRTRFEVFTFYKYLSFDLLLIGSPSNYNTVMTMLGAAGVENGIIAIIINFGLLITLFMLPLYFCFQVRKLKELYSIKEAVVILAVFYIIGFMNPNLSESTPWIYWIFTCYAFSNKCNSKRIKSSIALCDNSIAI